MPAVGDKVCYVPDICHAYNRTPDGSYAWQFGKRVPSRKPDASGEPAFDVVPLTDKEVEEILAHLARRPGDKKLLVAIAPVQAWPAVVRAVNPDGTLNLDIQSYHPAMTLHYDNIPADEARKPHTCHAAPAAPVG